MQFGLQQGNDMIARLHTIAGAAFAVLLEREAT